ncbi:MAG: preprotein translocase subunit SecA [Deltaproteobacteria bacterium]|nr:preprotein translocase subunit SecA [Deltaproteobacteria bacterium]
MVGALLKKVFGSKNDRELKRMAPIVDRVNSFENEMRAKSDQELADMTNILKDRLAQGETLDDILPEAFAVVREAGIRTLGMRIFDVQLIGGLVLHEGKIAEMKTGEGKTLAATLPVYLNALTEKGVHVVTVNDYLAHRDSEWMGAIYKFLGLTVGVIVHDMDDEERQTAYNSDVTYGTNNEFGFDYLRDNMKFRLEDMVQRRHHYAIVDEVDSILIDEARTPLIISGAAEESTKLYQSIDKIVIQIARNQANYAKDEKARTVVLTEEGVAAGEKLLGIDNLYEPKYIDRLHHVNQALKAHILFKRDVDYVVTNGEVIIVDEFTGRLMPGRRYSEGLHQALEAKEGVKVESENQTLATVTFQNYFRMYEKLAGMTGTADTEAPEFAKIYKLEVMVVPSNKKMIRIDYPDVIYKTQKDKFNAAIEEIINLNQKGQPVLVGTVSIEKSEFLAAMLAKRGVKHNVLNAKHHEQEALIISQAGQPGAVTISTNMAGRGTDIVLGTGVTDVGGLHILGTERHESRRIDNQLRGRAGRQGDIGSSRFYLSFEDDLLRIFGSDRITGLMDRMGMEDDEPIEHNLVTKAIESAQRKVEGHNFDIRKHLLEYDDVMNEQRKTIYGQRREILDGADLKDEMLNFIEEWAEKSVDAFTDPKTFADEWDLQALDSKVFTQFGFHLDLTGDVIEGLTQDDLTEMIFDKAKEIYDGREAEWGLETARYLERIIMLQVIDVLWKDHLLAMDHLKEGIGLRGYAQVDPLREYKKEGYNMFMEMVGQIKETALNRLFSVQLAEEEDLDYLEEERPQKYVLNRGDGDGQAAAQPVRRKDRKVGRNETCPCGSGRKFKKCCGRGQ